jgi:hypothetical protein
LHDAYFQLYDGYRDATDQLCVAHVIWELTAQIEVYPQEGWADQVRRASARLIEQADRARTAGIDHVPPEIGAVYLRILRQGVAVRLSLRARGRGAVGRDGSARTPPRARARVPASCWPGWLAGSYRC